MKEKSKKLRVEEEIRERSDQKDEEVNELQRKFQGKVYDVPFTASSVPVNGNRAKVPVAAHEGQKWCVSNGETAKEKLQEALDYACGEGGADCRPIQPGATCYHPELLEAHASYAFNSYYQKNARRVGTCYFGGAAHAVTQPPRHGKFQIRSTREKEKQEVVKLGSCGTEDQVAVVTKPVKLEIFNKLRSLHGMQGQED